MKVRYLVPLALCLVLSQVAFAQWVNMKNIKVATLDLVSRVSGESIDTATLTEMIQVALVDRHAFMLVERSLITKVLQEQEFQASGLTDSEAAKVGAIAGANKILSMTLSKLGGDYILILRSIDTSTAIMDLSDQVQSPTLTGFIDLIPVLAERFVRKARGEAVPPFKYGAPATVATASAPATLPPDANGIPRDGLVSEWTFDGAIKDTAIRRLTGAEDVTLGRDRFGKDKKAAWFNGRTSRINAGKIFTEPVGAYTVSAWLYVDRFIHPASGVIRGITLSNWNIYREGNQRGMDFGYFLNMDLKHGLFNTVVCDGAKDTASSISPVYPIAEFEKKYGKRWIHLCLVVSNGSATCYVDGGLAGAGKVATTMVPDPETPFWIGHSGIDHEKDKQGQWHQINFLAGAIDALRVYNRALSEEEIMALFEEPQ